MLQAGFLITPQRKKKEKEIWQAILGSNLSVLQACVFGPYQLQEDVAAKICHDTSAQLKIDSRELVVKGCTIGIVTGDDEIGRSLDRIRNVYTNCFEYFLSEQDIEFLKSVVVTPVLPTA